MSVLVRAIAAAVLLAGTCLLPLAACAGPEPDSSTSGLQGSGPALGLDGEDGGDAGAGIADAPPEPGADAASDPAVADVDVPPGPSDSSDPSDPAELDVGNGSPGPSPDPTQTEPVDVFDPESVPDSTAEATEPTTSRKPAKVAAADGSKADGSSTKVTDVPDAVDEETVDPDTAVTDASVGPSSDTSDEDADGDGELDADLEAFLAEEGVDPEGDLPSEDPSSELMAEPTPTDEPAPVMTGAPEALVTVSSPVGPLATVDIFTSSSPVGGVLTVRANLAVGRPAAGSSITVDGQGLKPTSPVTVSVYSDPIVVATGLSDAQGSVSLVGAIPAGLGVGSHAIDVRGTGVNDEVVQSIGAFDIGEGELVTAFAPPGQTTEFTAAGDPALERALAAGKPIYDPVRYPAMTAAIAVAGVAAITLAGIGGFSSGLSQGVTAPAPGRSGGGTDGSDGGKPVGGQSSRGKLAHASTRKLKPVATAPSGRGDRGRTWRWPGTDALDRLMARAASVAGRYSALAPRILVDGVWNRAMFGSLALGLWGVGLVLGIVAAQSVGFGPYPPALPFVLAIVVLGILDSAAGTVAWLVLAIGSAVTGQLLAWADLRTVLGMFVLYVALPLLAHVTRPLRRQYIPTAMGRFDRVCDYVMMPLMIAFAGATMYKAINGLSGLELVSLDGLTALRIAIVLALWARLALEDLALHAYPARSQAVQPALPPPPDAGLALLSVLIRTGVFILVAAPFFGLGWTTLLAAVLTAVPMVLKVWEDDLPNRERLNRFLPRGLLRFAMLLVVGMYLSAWVLGQDATDDAVRQTYSLLLLPGIVVGALAIFGRRGGDWPDTWRKRIAGGFVWLLAAGIVTGVINVA